MCGNITFNYSKLKGLIIEKFDSQGAFATAIGRSEPFVSQVLNNKSYLDSRDIEKWSEVLGIDKSDVGIYFFAH